MRGYRGEITSIVNMKKIRIVVMGLLLPLLNYSQSGTAKPIMSALAPGALVPRNMIGTLLKQQLSGNKVQPVEGKAIILDFFSVYCGTCIKKLPEMNALQEQYGSAVQILVVTNDEPALLREYMQRLQALKQNKLPILQSTEAIKLAFPHVYIPHLVWIDAKGRVSAITDAATVTSERITSWLKGEQLQWPFKRDLLDFDKKLPFAINPAMTSMPRYASYLTDSIAGVGAYRSQEDLSDGLHKRYCYINGNVRDLYLFALRFILAENRILANDAVNARLDNRYCYELILPKLHKDSIRQALMFQDLNSRLGLRAYVSNRTVNCRILRAIPEADALLKQATADSIVVTDDNAIRIKKAAIGLLVYQLNQKGPVLFDETSLKGKYSIAIPLESIHDLDVLNKALLPYGLHITEEERTIPMLVIDQANTF
jgi:thiol-disulfide isomerase/thioredoxin